MSFSRAAPRRGALKDDRDAGRPAKQSAATLVAAVMIAAAGRAAWAGPLMPVDHQSEVNPLTSILRPVERIAAADSSIEERLADAIRLFQDAKYDESLRVLQAVTKDHPQLPPARLMLSRMFLVAGHRDAARKLLEQVAREDGGYPGIYVTFGRLALLEGRITDAEAQFEKALAAVDETGSTVDFAADCRDGLGAVAEFREDWVAAESHLRALVALAPDDGRSHFRLGVALFHSGSMEAALESLRAGAAIDPDLPLPELVMSQLSEQAGSVEQSREWLDRAVASHPAEPAVHSARCLWLLRRDETDVALAEARQAVEIAPHDSDARFALALSLRQLRRFDEASDIFAQLHQEHPANLQSLGHLALCLVEQDDLAARRKGLQYAESLARQAPHERDSYATLGWALYRNGQLPQARQMLQQSIAGGQGPAEAGYYLACVLRDLGEDEQIPDLLAGAVQANGVFLHKNDVSQWLARLK